MITGHMASWSSTIGQTLTVYSEPGRQLSVQNSRLKSRLEASHMLRPAALPIGLVERGANS